MGGIGSLTFYLLVVNVDTIFIHTMPQEFDTRLHERTFLDSQPQPIVPYDSKYSPEMNRMLFSVHREYNNVIDVTLYVINIQKILSVILWKVSCEFIRPNGITSN